MLGRRLDYRIIAATIERGSGNGQINGSQSSQPQAKAEDQQKASAAKQAEKEGSGCPLTGPTCALPRSPTSSC
jgi:hypothetical protein